MMIFFDVLLRVECGIWNGLLVVIVVSCFYIIDIIFFGV